MPDTAAARRRFPDRKQEEVKATGGSLNKAQGKKRPAPLKGKSGIPDGVKNK